MNLQDKGAHYHKCDFQVHTPRDANWQGLFAGATSDDERKRFAASLVAVCRAQEILAIAITDHHDLCFFEFVAEAARVEVDHAGDPIPLVDQLHVFPGVELTLSNPPCQAILILDSDIDTDMFDKILSSLGITPTTSTLSVAPPPVALRTDLGFPKIGKILDSFQINNSSRGASDRVLLSGKYIILPNVKPGGHQTALRRGFHTLFSEMQCVGGYIEKVDYDSLNDGDKNILEGKIPEWTERPVGVIQTGDNRSAVEENGTHSFPQLGKWPTWIKWSLPSAEAIRQACIARTSRISYSKPELPTMRIRGVSVTDSRFLGAVELAINPQLNSIIGGRGTGKSTLFEYIRWTLFERPTQPPSDDLKEYDRRRTSLITNTLASNSGQVTVWYEKNSAIYTITRSSTNPSETANVILPNGTSLEMQAEQIQQEFPICGYSQKQLSSVGVLRDEVYRLLVTPINPQVQEIDRQIDDLIPDLKAKRRTLLRFQKIHNQLQELATSIRSFDEQSEALRKGIKEITPDQEAIVAANPIFLSEENWMRDLNLRLEEIMAILSSLATTIDAVPDASVPKDALHQEDMNLIASRFNEIKSMAISQVRSLFKAYLEIINEPNITRVRGHLDSLHVMHKMTYENLVSRSTNNERELQRLQKIDTDKSSLLRRISELEQEERSLTGVRDTIVKMEGDHQLLLSQRLNLLATQAKEMEQAQRHSLKVTVRGCADRRPMEVAVQSLLGYGAQIRNREEKSKNIVDAIMASPDVAAGWATAFSEFERILTFNQPITEQDFPILSKSSLTPPNVDALKRSLTQDQLEEFRYPVFADDVQFDFSLSRRADNYIPFEQASQGQQATILLKILLSQDGAPLLIDQPEEDIDNEQIGTITDSIIAAKSNRQMIFVSHNANLVVNGDTELVVVMGYPDRDDQSSTKIVEQGSIDSEPVKAAIIAVMEGGQEAFELRNLKYGFGQAMAV
ncbi:MAG: TrlF family AAA-like ATPase [Candidatus Kapaibacterium sp.]